jgi:transposase-like protein
LKVSDLQREYKSSFIDTWEGLDRAAKAFKKQLIEAALEAERTELLLCRSYERTEGWTDYRNGYWTRYIILKEGRLEIRMPRIRGLRFESRVIKRYQQRSKDVDEALLRVFLFSASPRRRDGHLTDP